MHTRTNLIPSCTVLVSVLIAATPSARAVNLLVDPGYEVNPLDTAFNVLNFFATYQGVWGVEAATITGVDGGVTPAQGVKMLRMVDDGLVATQGFQVTDVTSAPYAALIASGSATVNLSALFNAGPNVPAAISALALQFFSGPSYGTQIGTPIIVNKTLDNSASTWETASISGTIPVGTGWLLSQVMYNNASLLGNPGYVDAADLTIVPEPAAGIGLLALAATALRRRCRAACPK